MHAKMSYERQGYCQYKSADCCGYFTPLAAAQAKPALKAVTQVWVLPKEEEAASQAGTLLSALALAWALAKVASAPAERALRGRLLKQRLLRY